jgi:hypothetical protein
MSALKCSGDGALRLHTERVSLAGGASARKSPNTLKSMIKYNLELVKIKMPPDLY